MTSVPISEKLLDWYDHNARTLPWRLPPRSRKRPDPYTIWLSEVMLQQTTVATVIPYFETFMSRWPTVSDLANARDDDVLSAWAGLGYYARARNMLKTARIVHKNRNGDFPSDEGKLSALPGIGTYTAAAILAIAFQKPANVVDGNVERVMARLFAVSTPLPKAKVELSRLAGALVPQDRPGDYAQALMDLGATICTPKTPKCETCPVSKFCAGFAKGVAPSLPARAPKIKKPTKYAHVFIAVVNHDQVVVERRPPYGLLGGMIGLPHSPVANVLDMNPTPPFGGAWEDTGLRVRHTFTHFHLELNIHQANSAKLDLQSSNRLFVAELKSYTSLPTLFRKVLMANKATANAIRASSVGK